MNKGNIQTTQTDPVSKPQAKRRHSYGVNIEKVFPARPQLVLKRATTQYGSREKLFETPKQPDKPKTFQRQGSRYIRGSNSSLSELNEQGKGSKEGKDKSKHPSESGIWREFIEYILSINSDIGDFKKKEMIFGSRDPSEDYVCTVVEEIADKSVVWAQPYRSKSAVKSSRTGLFKRNRSMIKRPSELSNGLNMSLKEEAEPSDGSRGDGKDDRENIDDVFEVAKGNNTTPSSKGKTDIRVKKEGDMGNSNENDVKVNRRRSNDVQGHTSTNRPSSSKSHGERRHTICGNDMKDIFAPKHGRKSEGDVEIDGDDKPHSKWTVVRAGFEDHNLKKIQSDKLEGWDFLAQTMAAMGKQTSTRQILYMRYLKRPNDWRKGLSPRACGQYQYIFSEADLMKKDAFRWKNLGVKPPKLSDRIQQKYRPKTSPLTSRGTKRMTSQSSVDFYETGDQRRFEERPFTAL